MPEEYGSLKHRVPKAEGEAPDAPKAFKEFSDSITKPPTGSAKQIAIVQGTGAIAYQSMKGDATLAEDGSLTIANDAINAAKIAENAVGASEIAANAVGASEIAEDAVGASEIAAGAVGESELADGAATSRKTKLTVGKAEGGSVAVSNTEKTIIVPALELVLPAKSHVIVWPMMRRALSTKGMADFYVFVDGVEKAFIGTLPESTAAEAVNASSSTGGSAVLENLATGTRKIDLRAIRGTATTCQSLASYFTYMVVAS